MTAPFVDVTSLAPAGVVACATRTWRGPRTRHLTVVVKVMLELVPGGRARVVPGAAIAAKERHYRGLPTRSVEEASDLAPYLARCDVTLRGHAHAPGGQPVATSAVRLAIQGQARILDRTLHVVGERAGAGAPPQPFQRMPLDWEHAFGGKAVAENPVGRGADASGSGAVPANVVDPADPRRPASFAPISRYWPARARALGVTPRGAVDGDEPTVGDGFDWGYYQVAPSEQQVPWLAGEEWLVLDGVHPLLPRVQTQLPALRGAALVLVHAGGVYGPARPVELHADTLAIDADRLHAAMVWRGSVVLEPGLELSQLRVLGALQVEGEPVAWPDLRTLEAPRAHGGETGAGPAALGSGTVMLPDDAPAVSVGSGTVAVLPDDERIAALPFSQRAAPPAPPPPPPGPPPAPEPAPMLGTINLSPDDEFQASLLPTTPFREGASVEEALEGARRAAGAIATAPDSGATGLGRTVGLSFGEAQLAARRAVTPFPTAHVTRSPASARGEAGTEASGPRWVADDTTSNAVSRARRRVPKRESPNVPIVNVTTLDAATTPWQVQPPQDSLTVIVKGTFDIVPGGAMTLREESDLLDGDRHVEDDMAKSLVTASDFALVKPRADVTLSGHAHASGKPATVVRVNLRFGGGAAPTGFDRAIAVLGERSWKRSGSSFVPGDPAPFTSMPVVWERAFGGPQHGPNPVGVGHAAPGAPPAPLPNLEDPRKPIMAPTDVPAPACFGPVAPAWAERSSRLGTYDDLWVATRWPYFPTDFDWGSFQAAPSLQQIDHPHGDESFEVRGMHPDHAKLEGRLPGLRVRAFALEREELGGDFFEIALKLDTVHLDVDAMKATLVWRGLCEVTDDEAPELETLFIHTEPLADAALPLPVVKELLFEAVAPDLDEAEEPPGPALTEAPQALAADPALREACVAALATGAALDGASLAGADLSGLDFGGRSMRGVEAKDASMRGARLAGADLSAAQLGGVDLTDADLRGANLAGADLTGATLEGARLDGASLEGADLTGVRAERAVFVEVSGEGVQLVGGRFADARFDRARLAGADFTEANLDRAVLEGAVMPEVRLYYAKAEGARFDRAQIDEARCDDARLLQCSFAGVKAPGSTWEKAELSGSTFAGAQLAEASFSRTIAEKVSFQGIDAPESRFARARLAGANLAGANLREADFERADLTGADLRAANLHGAETWKAKLKGARLDEAILTLTKLAPPALPKR